MFAVIKTGGKQYRVAADDVLAVDKIKGDPGDTIQFGEVLVLGGDTVQLGSPAVAGAWWPPRSSSRVGTTRSSPSRSAAARIRAANAAIGRNSPWCGSPRS